MILKRATWAVALLACAAVPALAQQSYTYDFEGGASGWTPHGLWAVDGTPSAAPGGAAYSGQKSLNFNDGTSYAGVQRASVASPGMVGMAGYEHTLQFRCNYQTETTGTDWDQRGFVVRMNGTVVSQGILGGTSNVAQGLRCSAMGTWHQHEIRIPASNAARTQVFNVEFTFDSGDDYLNDFAGWFVDDVHFQSIQNQSVPAFTSISRETGDFRQNITRITILADKSVEIARSSPTARYAPINGTATAAEFSALETAVSRANLGGVVSPIPDPNTYIVAPTWQRLECVSNISSNHATIVSTLGIYGQWDGQIRPVMDAIEAILNRLLQSGGTPSGDDHGDTPQAATPLDLDPAVPPTSGFIGTAGDVDVFQVAEIVPAIAIFPPPQSTYTFETTVVGNMDTMIDLLDQNGNVLATDDDGGAGLASRLVRTDVRGTVFYVRVRHYSSTGTGAYTIRATSVPVGGSPVGDDHGNTPQTATTISEGAAATAGSIDPAGDVDYFTMQLVSIMIFPPPTYTFVFETKVIGNMDTVLELYDANGTLLASNDDAPGMGWASRIEYVGPATSYFLKVRHYSGSGTGDYTVSVTQTLNP